MQAWRCSRTLCPAWATTCDTTVPHHPCRYAAGLMIPLVRVDTHEDVRLVTREDHVGAETVAAFSDGAPIMATQRVRDDGVDTTVYAPTARASTDDEEAARARP